MKNIRPAINENAELLGDSAVLWPSNSVSFRAPLVADFEVGTAVAHAIGIVVFVAVDEADLDGDRRLVLDMHIPNQRIALALLRGIRHDTTIAEFNQMGFREI
jgi:hypothetical protein